jgi:16S rRNA (guanine527-N7)-methyltransferase
VFAEVSGRLVAPGGTLLAMKGVPPLEEIARLKGHFKLSNLTPLHVPGLDAERHLVFLQAA